MTDARLLLPRFLIGLLLALAAGCQSRTSDRSLVFIDPPDVDRIVNTRKGPAGLGGQRAVAWVDPRPEARFAEGHIEGSINLPFPRVSDEHHKLAAYDILIVYGDDYNDPLADGMSKRLIELGHRDVRTLRGGLRAWSSSGRDLVKGGSG
jgi:3-mercaptopyruvate sulfurtransferase SseA